MSVIFQLFNAEDLQQLDGNDLQTLKRIVTEALQVDDRQALKRLVSEALQTDKTPVTPQQGPPALSLELAPKFAPSKEPPAQINEALNKRFHDVSQQLKLSSPQSPFDFDKLTRRHFNDPNEREREKEKLILEWAISCEVNNFEFYTRLLNARIAGHDFFIRKTGQRPKGPDSVYSPFNPRHPLYNLYYGLADPDPEPPQGGAAPSS